MEGDTVASLLAGIILPTPHTSPQEQITLHYMLCSLCALPELSKEFSNAICSFVLVIDAAFDCQCLLGFRKGVVGFCFLKNVLCQYILRDPDPELDVGLISSEPSMNTTHQIVHYGSINM